MEAFNIKNLSFKYAGSDFCALKDIDLNIEKGEFVALIGESGSSKTTLLKLLKKELSPKGELNGEIFFEGIKIKELSHRDSAQKIGYISQNPDSQLVTDKVYSELAFGLENLGFGKEEIRSRVSEFASFFKLSDCFNMNVNDLSGGQKQLLNLASVMTMRPEVLLLDEPTSMLDPVSAIDFITALKRLCDDLGTTVIIAEHRLADILPIADRVVCLENGEIIADAPPRSVCCQLKDRRIYRTLPEVSRLFYKLGGEGEAPLTIREGRKFLYKKNNLQINCSDKEIKTEPILTAKELWFRYERKTPDILKGVSFNVNRGEVYALVGANGCGKSTLIGVLSGRLKAYRGKVKRGGKIAVLPQNPRDLFVKDTLEEDFKSVNNSYTELCNAFEITSLLSRHPYDLSGGELQKAAVVKLLLSSPSILMLDEPTKGLDSFAKSELGELLGNLGDITVLLVAHDLEFAAEFSDRCGLLFDGEITSEDNSREFFSSNNFYTTRVVRLTRGIIEGAVTEKDLYEE